MIGRLYVGGPPSHGSVMLSGHYFWLLDRNSVPGPAHGITQIWGVPSPIDTAFTRCNCQGKTYIFKVSVLMYLTFQGCDVCFRTFFFVYIFRHILVVDCDLCREPSIGDLRMMFWTLAIQSSFQKALMGFVATSQLLCLCLSTAGGESLSTSSREVINCQVYKADKVVFQKNSTNLKFFIAFIL